MLEFTPSLVGCMIWSGNHSHAMIRESRECVINLPTTALTDTGRRRSETHPAPTSDKFERFGVTADQGLEG